MSASVTGLRGIPGTTAATIGATSSGRVDQAAKPSCQGTRQARARPTPTRRSPACTTGTRWSVTQGAQSGGAWSSRAPAQPGPGSGGWPGSAGDGPGPWTTLSWTGAGRRASGP